MMNQSLRDSRPAKMRNAKTDESRNKCSETRENESKPSPESGHLKITNCLTIASLTQTLEGHVVDVGGEKFHSAVSQDHVCTAHVV